MLLQYFLVAWRSVKIDISLLQLLSGLAYLRNKLVTVFVPLVDLAHRHEELLLLVTADHTIVDAPEVPQRHIKDHFALLTTQKQEYVQNSDRRPLRQHLSEQRQVKPRCQVH